MTSREVARLRERAVEVRNASDVLGRLPFLQRDATRLERRIVAWAVLIVVREYLG